MRVLAQLCHKDAVHHIVKRLDQHGYDKGIAMVSSSRFSGMTPILFSCAWFSVLNPTASFMIRFECFRPNAKHIYYIDASPACQDFHSLFCCGRTRKMFLQCRQQ